MSKKFRCDYCNNNIRIKSEDVMRTEAHIKNGGAFICDECFEEIDKNHVISDIYIENS